MAKRKNVRKQKPTKVKSKFASRPAAPKAPSRDKLRKLFREMVPHIRAMGFNNVVLVGYRRVPGHEQQVTRGADEVPEILHDFRDPFQATALLNWAYDSGERSLISMAASMPPPEPEEKEKEKDDT
jgi:hypothetical protein